MNWTTIRENWLKSHLTLITSNRNLKFLRMIWQCYAGEKNSTIENSSIGPEITEEFIKVLLKINVAKHSIYKINPLRYLCTLNVRYECSTRGFPYELSAHFSNQLVPNIFVLCASYTYRSPWKNATCFHNKIVIFVSSCERLFKCVTFRNSFAVREQNKMTRWK